MGWVKIEDRYSRNAKIMQAGEAGLALDVCGLCYCREHNTNGFVPDHVLTVLGPVKQPKRVVRLLEQVGRWDRDDDLGGWWIHDYLECNPSDEEDREAAEARSDRARAAARARWDARSNADASDEQSEIGASGNADALPPTPPVPARSTRATRVPEPFDITDQLLAWAESKTPGLDLVHHTERFVNYWKAKPGKDATKLDWLATWQNWMLKEYGDRPRRPVPARGEPPIPSPYAVPVCEFGICGGNGNVTDADGEYLGRCKCVGGPVEAVPA